MSTHAEGPTTGFTASAHREEQFIQQVVARRYGQLEVPLNRGILCGTAAFLCAVWAMILVGRGALDLAFATALGAILLLGLAALRYRNWRRRSDADSVPDPFGCFLSAEGLMPLLEPGEEMIGHIVARAPGRRVVRVASGVTQLVWGLLLSGLPLMSVTAEGGQPSGVGLAFWSVAFTVVGALVAGRGVRDLISLYPAVSIALTNLRLVAMARPGAARSVWIATLAHRPVVVERVDGSATFAAAAPRLVSAGMLPIRGLLGSDGMDVSEARQWARAITEARNALDAAVAG